MSLLRRIHNLWELSAYRAKQEEVRPGIVTTNRVLVKDIPTIQKKLATIISEPVDYFKEENGEVN